MISRPRRLASRILSLPLSHSLSPLLERVAGSHLCGMLRTEGDGGGADRKGGGSQSPKLGEAAMRDCRKLSASCTFVVSGPYVPSGMLVAATLAIAHPTRSICPLA